jgi:hypothetical protein
VVGVDENRTVPALAEDIEIEQSISPVSDNSSNESMDVDSEQHWENLKRWCTMRVLDGVVMGPTVNFSFKIIC